jgi:2-iminoacetate synthase ThiH
MSALVDGAIGRAGLAPVLHARRAGAMNAEHVELLRRADLLVLGALADRVRAEEVGDEVRIFTSLPSGDDGACVVPPEGREVNGLDLLRDVAMARLTGPRGVRVRVDWTRSGLEIAQVALGFGANELVGRIASKRGLPLAEGEVLGVGKRSRMELAELVKRRELEGFVRRAGRTPAFASEAG